MDAPAVMKTFLPFRVLMVEFARFRNERGHRAVAACRNQSQLSFRNKLWTTNFTAMTSVTSHKETTMNTPKILLLIFIVSLGFTSCKSQGRPKQDKSGMYSVVEKGKYGFMDKEGKVVINPQFESVSDFSEGMAMVRIGAKCAYIDTTGRMVINPQFEGCFDFSEGLAAVT